MFTSLSQPWSPVVLGLLLSFVLILALPAHFLWGAHYVGAQTRPRNYICGGVSLAFGVITLIASLSLQSAAGAMNSGLAVTLPGYGALSFFVIFTCAIFAYVLVYSLSHRWLSETIGTLTMLSALLAVLFQIMRYSALVSTHDTVLSRAPGYAMMVSLSWFVFLASAVATIIVGAFTISKHFVEQGNRRVVTDPDPRLSDRPATEVGTSPAPH